MSPLTAKTSESVENPKQAENENLPMIVLFGDSLTEWSFDRGDEKGLGDVLTNQLKGKVDVINDGHAGFTTDTIKPAFTHLRNFITRSESNLLLITIWLGANDATFSYANVPLDKFISNIRLFVDTILRGHPSTIKTKIAIMTPPPIECQSARAGVLLKDAREKIGYLTYVNKMKYAQAIVKLAEEYGEKDESKDRIVLVDMWRGLVEYALQEEGRVDFKLPETLEEKDVADLLLPGCGLPGAKRFHNEIFQDGLHFDGFGYDIVTTTFLETIKQKWPDLLS